MTDRDALARAIAPYLGPDDDLDEAVEAMLRYRDHRVRRAAAARKRCSRCREIRPIASFGVNTTRPDGLQAECRECRRYRYRNGAEIGPI